MKWLRHLCMCVLFMYKSSKNAECRLCRYCSNGPETGELYIFIQKPQKTMLISAMKNLYFIAHLLKLLQLEMPFTGF